MDKERPNKTANIDISPVPENRVLSPPLEYKPYYSTMDVDMACALRAKDSGIPECTFKFMDPDDVEEVHAAGAFLAEVFIEREPLSHALVGNNKKVADIFRRFCQVLSAEGAAAGISPIAKTADGSIVGVLMVTPWKWNAPPKTAPPELEPMWDLLGRLDVAFENYPRASSNAKAAKIIELGYGAVDSKFESHGILTSAVYLAILKAHQKGFDEAIVKATSKSQAIIQRIGFTVLAEVPYKDFEYCGTRPFASIKNPFTIQLKWADMRTFLQGFNGSLPKARL